MNDTHFKKRFAQEWPRYSIGAFAIWGLMDSLQAFFLGIRLNSFVNNQKVLGGAFSFRGQGAHLGPEEEDRMIKATLIIFGGLFTLIHAIALYGAIRKSITAIKTSLIVWIVQMSWLTIAIVIMFIGLLGMSDRDREGLPRPSGWDIAVLAGSSGLTLFHGWSLFVFLRDLKSRSRNVWGLLVKHDQGVFDYEPVDSNPGPVHL